MMWILDQTPVQKLESELLSQAGVDVWVKRDDLTHPLVMGNKWRKLKYNLQEAKSQKKSAIVTYGGAYSNHIIATAAACHKTGLKSYGIIRGDELNPDSNPMLQKSNSLGMEFYFASREEFRTLKDDLTVPDSMKLDLNTVMILPEGGTNALAVRGCSEILANVSEGFDVCACAMGTGGTFLGLLSSIQKEQKLWGFSALKGNWIHESILQMKEEFGVENDQYHLFEEDVFGGYARTNQNLIQFILDFRQEHGILLDPIYTGKMFYRVWVMIKNHQIAKGTRLLMVHTGGIQGIEGFNHRFGWSLPTS